MWTLTAIPEKLLGRNQRWCDDGFLLVYGVRVLVEKYKTILEYNAFKKIENYAPKWNFVLVSRNIL